MIPDTIWQAVEQFGEAEDIPEEWVMEIDCLDDDDDPFSDATIDGDGLTLTLRRGVTAEQLRFAATLHLVLDTACVPVILRGDVSHLYHVPVAEEFGFVDVANWDRQKLARVNGHTG